MSVRISEPVIVQRGANDRTRRVELKERKLVECVRTFKSS